MEVLKKATWPPSPRVRPIRNWAPNSFMTKMTLSISQLKVLCFKIMVLRVSLLQLVIIIIVSLFWGGPQESHLTPLSTRTTNKELSAERFMTKMTQSISQSKVLCFKIMVLRVSLLQLVIIIRVSILNHILGRSSRKPPDPPLHAYDQ